MKTSSDKNTATITHLSTLSQYFIPFGNFIFPVIIWSASKDKSEYIDQQGKQVINFQLSLFLYTLILALIAAPIFIITFLKGFRIDHMDHGDFDFEQFNTGNISGLLIIGIVALVVFGFLKIAEFFLTIYAAVKTSNGIDFKYPMTIPFLKKTPQPEIDIINETPEEETPVTSPS